MTKTKHIYPRNIPRYIYIQGTLKDYIHTDGKIKFLLKPGELQKYCESFIKEVHDSFSKGIVKFCGDYEVAVLQGKNGEEAQVKFILELPSTGPASWLEEVVSRCWGSNAITGDLVYREIFESFSMDRGFFETDWREIRGSPVRDR